LQHQDNGYLPPDAVLYFYHRKTAVQVSDLSGAYDGRRRADPAEPDYRDGTDAIFHWRGGDWLINSFAHGVQRTYRAVPVPPPDPDEEDMQDLLQRATLAGQHHQNGTTPHTGRPTIKISTDVSGLVNAAIAALQLLPQAPVLYQRARALCVIARHGTPPQWLRRQADTPLIHEASPAHLWELVTTAADWEKYDARKKEWNPATPPRWVVEVVQGRSSWPFPMLEGIVCSPTLRPDGSLLVTPGYDASTGLYLDCTGTTFPALPAKPTLDDARSALGRAPAHITVDTCGKKFFPTPS
jgi:hypothetical protein